MPGAVPRRSLLVPLLLLSIVAGACTQAAAPKTDAELAADSLERGSQAHNAGRLDEAKVAYFETLFRDPNNKFAYYNLGQIARIAGKMGIAEGYYRSALEIDPEMIPALDGFAVTRLAAGAWQEAADAEAKVVRGEPGNAAAHYNFALALRQLGREAEAAREFQSASRLDPKLVPPATPTPTPTPRPT